MCLTLSSTEPTDDQGVGMQESDILLADGRRARASDAGIAIIDTAGEVRETIPFAEIGAAHRSGQTITLHARSGGSRSLTAASVLDADQLTNSLPPDIPVTFAPSPLSSSSHSASDVPGGRGGRSADTMRWVATGCLSVFSLILLCPILFLAYWAYDGVNGGLEDTVYADLLEGETAEVGGLIQRYRVTILETEDNPQSTIQSEQPAGGFRFWIVRVRVENTGLVETSDSLFGSPDWYLRPRGGGSLGEWDSFQGFGPVIDGSIILQAGEAVEGVLVFQVPIDEEVDSLVLSMGVNDDELVFRAP